MQTRFSLQLAACALLGIGAACDSSDDMKAQPQRSKDAGTSRDVDAGPPPWATVLDLSEVKANPNDYTWFDFRPNVQKLILSGAAETEHIAILWYTTEDGGVGLHYHGKTESVYVIEGSQTDGKGKYPTGTVYFNPPGSGHQITESSGFFLLAYAAPPDFTSTDKIGEYTPVRIDTTASDLTRDYPFEAQSKGIAVFDVPLESSGGMSAQIVELTASAKSEFTGNYVLVLEGKCSIAGASYGDGALVVAKTIETHAFALAAPAGKRCLALGVSF